MPVARSQGHAGRALLIAAAGVLLSLGVAFALSVLDNRGKVEVRLGDETFSGAQADEMAEDIAERGPFLVADASPGGDRDIVLQHLGDDVEGGWIAIAARPSGVPRNCAIQWQAEDEVFHLLDEDGGVAGECDGTEYPADGGGLETFPVTVEDGKLDVDLNAAERSSTTTAG